MTFEDACKADWLLISEMDIDPDSEHDWFSLAYGFLLGKGLTPAQARKIALAWRYDEHIA